MTVTASAAVGGANAARRNAIMDVVRDPADASYQIPHPDVSGLDRANNAVLDVAESAEFNYAVMGGTAAWGAGTAAMGAAGAATAAGATVGVATTAAATAAAASLGTFAVAAGAGIAGGYAGAWAGDKLADFVFGDLGGEKKVATEGDTPARLGDPIAHVNKNAGLLGAIIGAVAAVAVVAIAVVTLGAGLVVLAAAAAVAGFVGAGIAAFASKAGQYGANKGAIALGSPNVFFEGKPVARVGDLVACSDHPGPMVLAEGAKTVYANGKNIARVGHRTTCDGNINGGCSTIVETIETAVVFEVKDSRSPLLRWANVIVNLLPLPRNKAGKPPKADATPPKTDLPPLKHPERGPNWPEPEPPPPRTESAAGNGCSPTKCSKAGEPVDVGTGDFLQEWPVLDIPGTIAVVLGRTYRSTAAFHGSFGPGWADEWAQRLELGEQTITFHTAHGATLVYHAPDDAVHAINLREGRYVLSGRRSGVLRLFDRDTRRVLSFSARGSVRALTDIEDLNGNRVRFVRDAAGVLQSIVHGDGWRLDVRSEQGRITEVRLPDAGLDDDVLLRCAYDAAGRLCELRSQQFGTLFHEYDARGRMTSWRDTDQTRAWIDYDELGRVIATRTASGHYEDRFEYDDAARCTTYIDAEGGSTRYFHNSDGLVTRRIDPLGHEWLTEWDDLTRKQGETDPLGRSTRYAYDDEGRLTAVETPDGQKRTLVYGVLGQLASIEEPAGTWQFRHDPRGNVVAVIDPRGRRTGFRIDARGQLLRRDEHDGSQWRYEYDAYHRLCEVVQPDGSRTRWSSDVLGRVRHVTDALGHATAYEYSAGHADPRGSASAVVLPDGTRLGTVYNSEHLPIAQIDGEGRQSTARYGAFDLLLEQNAAGTGHLRFEYDRLTRLTAVVNGVGERYTYSYDAASRVIRETDYGGASTQYRYNAAGWLLERKEADGGVSRYTHDDASGRLLAIERETEGAVERTTLDYDDAGFLIRLANPHAVVEYERDAFGRVLAERIDGREVRYDWDDLSGRPAALIAGQTVQWRFDANGALAQLAIDGHAPLHIDRDRLGRDIARRSAAGFNLEQQFNPLGLLTAQHAGPDAADWQRAGLPDVGVQRQYRYDRAFNPVEISDARWGRSRYRYDAQQQIVATHLDGGPRHTSSERGFHYDAALNLSAQTVSQLPHVQRHDVVQHAGRVVQRGKDRYRYDARGRLVEKIKHLNGFRPRHWHYRWNADDRLVELRTPDGERWHYAYDALGRRIRKLKLLPNGQLPELKAESEAAGEPAPLNPSPLAGEGQGRGGNVAKLATNSASPQPQGEQYLWAGDQLIEAAPIYADGTVAWSQATRWAYAPGGITPLAQHKAGKLWYVVADHLGTPRELLSEAGEVEWSNSPETWGQHRLWSRRAANDDAVECPHRFPGQYFDAESGLHYNRHRYYDPGTAQYLSPDPLKLGGGFRPQGYVHDPNGWVDPLGLAPCPELYARYKAQRDLGLSPADAYAAAKNPGRGYHNETYAPKPVKPQDAVNNWNRFLGDGPYTNRHPRTGQPDPDRIVSADGSRSIRYGDHEMGSKPTKHHYHEETWTYDPLNNVINVDNSVVRVPGK